MCDDIALVEALAVKFTRGCGCRMPRLRGYCMFSKTYSPSTPILSLVSDKGCYETYADGSKYISSERGGTTLASPCGRYQIAPIGPAEIVDIGRGRCQSPRR